MDGDVHIGSSESYTSKTLYPNVKIDEETRTTLVDCAGFEDSRCEEKDLVASFLNKLILDSSKNLKIVIVENYSKFVLHDGDRVAFLNVLNHVATILHHTHAFFHDSLCLVVTKCGDSRDNEKC